MVAADDSTIPSGCPAPDMVARMLSEAAVVGPVALAATESVSEAAAAVAVAVAAVELHMRYYVQGRHAGLHGGYEVAGTRRRVLGMGYSRAGRICFGSTHMSAMGRLVDRSQLVAVPVHAIRSVG